MVDWSLVVGELKKHQLKKLQKVVSSEIRKKYGGKSKDPKYGNINKGFTEQELKLFLSSCKNEKAYLAFYLMAHMGLRVSEVVGIKISDIDFHSGKVRIDTLKANTGDFQHMTQGVRKLLLSWVQKFPKEIEEHEGYVLFSGNPVQSRIRISSDWLRKEFRMVCKIANLDEWYCKANDEDNPKQKENRRLHRLTTHSLRHYFITRVYEHTKNPIMAQKLARHRSFKSTQTYINIDYGKLGKVVEDVFEPQQEQDKKELVEFMEAFVRFKRKDVSN